MKTGVKQVKQ